MGIFAISFHFHHSHHFHIVKIHRFSLYSIQSDDMQITDGVEDTDADNDRHKANEELVHSRVIQLFVELPPGHAAGYAAGYHQD